MFFTLSFSMVSIPIEGKELTLVSERSLETQRDEINSCGHKAVPVANPSMCSTWKIKII